MNQQIDPSLDLVSEIKKLQYQKNAVILAHYYQEPDIQDVADFIGDSLGLSQKAAETRADIIVFAGVHFMAETAKILNPTKKVLLPDLKAGCSLSNGCPPEALAHFKAKYPDHMVISYINCSAGVKAMSDIICTSSNARKIVESLPVDMPIIFAPDRNLGAYINKISHRNMVLYPGSCQVHEAFSLEKITKLMSRYPKAAVIAHPECEDAVLQEADFIGSTAAMLKFVENESYQQFIVATEPGIIHQMQKLAPTKEFIPAPPNANCACNECPYMKLNTLEKLYLCLRDETPEITLDEELRVKAKVSIDRMLDMSRSFGL